MKTIKITISRDAPESWYLSYYGYRKEIEVIDVDDQWVQLTNAEFKKAKENISFSSNITKVFIPKAHVDIIK